MTLDMKGIFLQACAVPPAQRKEQIDKNMKALQLGDSGKQNEWLANMQIRITPKPLSVCFAIYFLSFFVRIDVNSRIIFVI